MNKNLIYKVSFINQGHLYEMFAKNIKQSDIYGFVEIEEYLFGETSGILLCPQEERLKSEFEGVSSSLIPIHAVVRIDRVKKRGVAKIKAVTDKGDKITAFPKTTSYFSEKDFPTK